MSDKIEPALTAEEWGMRAFWRSKHMVDVDHLDGGLCVRVNAGGGNPDRGIGTIPPEEIPALIAIANAVLPDSDRRKITRETIELLRAAGDRLPGKFANSPDPDEQGLAIHALAVALESYLPPTDG